MSPGRWQCLPADGSVSQSKRSPGSTDRGPSERSARSPPEMRSPAPLHNPCLRSWSWRSNLEAGEQQRDRPVAPAELERRGCALPPSGTRLPLLQPSSCPGGGRGLAAGARDPPLPAPYAYQPAGAGPPQAQNQAEVMIPSELRAGDAGLLEVSIVGAVQRALESPLSRRAEGSDCCCTGHGGRRSWRKAGGHTNLPAFAAGRTQLVISTTR